MIALAQRPRADLEPVEVEDVHHRLGDERARDALVGPVRRDARAARRRSASVIRTSGVELARARRRAGRAHQRAVAGRAPRRRSGPASGTSSTWPTAWSGTPGAEHGAGVAGDLGTDPACAARAPSPGPAGRGGATRGSAGPRRAGATGRRPAPRRTPAAISSEPPPMSKTASRPRTSRTSGVRRGRSAAPRPRPASTCDGRPRSASRTRSSTSSELLASRTAEVANASISSHPLSSATFSAVGDEVGERVDPGLGDRAVLVEVLGEPQRPLEGVRRQRRGTTVGVDHEQVPGVGADVEDAQSHAANATAAACRSAARPHVRGAAV